MARPKSKIACIESLTIGTCTVALTLDGRYRSEDGTYLCSIRFTMNRGRYYYHLGDRYTADEFDAIDKSTLMSAERHLLLQNRAEGVETGCRLQLFLSAVCLK